jgi:hypothetical protein
MQIVGGKVEVKDFQSSRANGDKHQGHDDRHENPAPKGEADALQEFVPETAFLPWLGFGLLLLCGLGLTRDAHHIKRKGNYSGLRKACQNP